MNQERNSSQKLLYKLFQEETKWSVIDQAIQLFEEMGTLKIPKQSTPFSDFTKADEQLFMAMLCSIIHTYDLNYYKPETEIHIQKNERDKVAVLQTMLRLYGYDKLMQPNPWSNTVVASDFLTSFLKRNHVDTHIPLLTDVLNVFNFEDIKDLPISSYGSTETLGKYLFSALQYNSSNAERVTQSFIKHNVDLTTLKSGEDHLFSTYCNQELWKQFLKQGGDPHQIIHKSQKPLYQDLLDKSFKEQDGLLPVLLEWSQSNTSNSDDVISQAYFKRLQAYTPGHYHKITEIKETIMSSPKWDTFVNEQGQTAMMLAITKHKGLFRSFATKKHQHCLFKRDNDGNNVLHYLMQAKAPQLFQDALDRLLEFPQLSAPHPQGKGLLSSYFQKNNPRQGGCFVYSVRSTSEDPAVRKQEIELWFGDANEQRSLVPHLIQHSNLNGGHVSNASLINLIRKGGTSHLSDTECKGALVLCCVKALFNYFEKSTRGLSNTIKDTQLNMFNERISALLEDATLDQDLYSEQISYWLNSMNIPSISKYFTEHTPESVIAQLSKNTITSQLDVEHNTQRRARKL